MNNRQLLLFFTIILIAFSLYARQAATQNTYVSIEKFNALPFPSPPAPCSEKWKNDSAVLADWRGKRSQADCDRADSSFFVAFDSFWGKKSPFPEPLPVEVQVFFDRLDSDIGTIAKVMKNCYKRPRPDNPSPCPWTNARMKKNKGYSYPSTHAAISRVFANVLTDIVPQRKSAFIARADEIARDRVIIGVHYPSDIAAGKDLGDLFHAELIKSEAYRNDLVNIKALLVK